MAGRIAHAGDLIGTTMTIKAFDRFHCLVDSHAKSV